MNEYEEEPEHQPELEDAPIGEEKTVSIELKVSPEAIVRASVDRMLNAYDRGGMGDVIEKQVRLRIDKLVEARVEELVRTRCEEIVNKLIDDGLRMGFPQYDSYGRSEKRTETLLGCQGRPSGRTKNSPVSGQAGPAASFWAALRAW